MSSWKGFLPQTAVVMATSQSRVTVAPLSESAPEPEAAAETPVFHVLGEIPKSGSENLLFKKMLSAIGVELEQVKAITELDPAQSTYVLSLEGPGEIYENGPARVFPIPTPAQLAQEPAQKKVAWTMLKRLAGELGLSIPSKGTR